MRFAREPFIEIRKNKKKKKKGKSWTEIVQLLLYYFGPSSSHQIMLFSRCMQARHNDQRLWKHYMAADCTLDTGEHGVSVRGCPEQCRDRTGGEGL